MNFVTSSIGNVKKYWDTSPCNIRHSNAPFGTKKYFDEVEKRKYFVEPHIPKFAQFKKWKGKRVLEIGCGIGTDTINFARSGATVTTIDLSKKSLEITRRRAKLFHVDKKISFYHGNAEKLSSIVPIKKYDLIYSFGVIHHTPHPERVIKELKKYATKETVVKIMVYYKYSWKVFWILVKYGKGVFWRLNQLIAQYSEAVIGSPVTYVYSQSDIRNSFLRDFRIIQMSPEHIFPYKIKPYRAYRYEKTWYFKYIPMFLFEMLEKHIGWHLCITARLK